VTDARSSALAAFALAASFAGIAAYIGVAEQPARLALADPALLTQWKISFAAGFAIQGSTAIAAALLGAFAWWRIGDRRFIASAALMLANWPWTMTAIAPVNAALMAMSPDTASAVTRELVECWGQPHAVRTALGAAALAVFAWALLRPRG
jgi:hypothetical protein